MCTYRVEESAVDHSAFTALGIGLRPRARRVHTFAVFSLRTLTPAAMSFIATAWWPLCTTGMNRVLPSSCASLLTSAPPSMSAATVATLPGLPSTISTRVGRVWDGVDCTMHRWSADVCIAARSARLSVALSVPLTARRRSTSATLPLFAAATTRRRSARLSVASSVPPTATRRSTSATLPLFAAASRRGADDAEGAVHGGQFIL